MIYLTADPHFGHTNIIKYCKRPFENALEMDNAIIKNYNSVVTDDDDVYILGDFSMCREKSILKMYAKELKGRKHLVLGNHDRMKNPWAYISIGFTSVHAPYVEIDKFVGVHDPALAQADDSRQFLCGHIHNLFKIQKNCYNVGVDVHNFYPISIDFIKDDLSTSKKLGKNKVSGKLNNKKTGDT